MACVRRNSNFRMTQKNIVGRWHWLSLVRSTHKQRLTQPVLYRESKSAASLHLCFYKLNSAPARTLFYDSRTLRALSSFFIIHTLFNEQERTRDDRLHGRTVVHPEQGTQTTRNPFRREVVVDNVIINPCLGTITHNSSPVVSMAQCGGTISLVSLLRGHA
jgi:hypothetical protein